MNAVTEKPVAEKPAQSEAPLTPAARRRRILRALRLAGVLAVLLAAVVVGHWWIVEGSAIESTDDAYVQGDIAVLSPRVEGTVAAIRVADNQRVKAGQVLIALDPSDLAARRDQARAALAEAEASAQTAERQVAQATMNIAQSDAVIAQARAEAVRAATDAGRSGALVGSGWTSRQANDLAVATAEKARAALAAAEAQRRMAGESVSVARAQLAQAQAKVQSARAALTLAENSLSYAEIRAPFDGIVGNRAAQLGQHVSPGQQLIAVAPPPEHLFVIANFKETQLRHMMPGQHVLLTADIRPGSTLDARVDSIAPATGALFSLLPPENATGNFTKVVQRVPVKLVLDAGEAAAAPWLRAGLSVTAEVDTRDGSHAIRGILGSALHTIGLE